MAKKRTGQRNRNLMTAEPVDLSLPQNIVLFGEQNPEDKKVYISQDVYKEIHRFTKDKTTNESGGVLLGNVIEEFGKTHIIIRAFIEAKYCEGTPTTLKFTHESWDYIHKEEAKRYPEYKILGWIHTHPDFGIFLSEYDKFIHENFFNGENQVAYVVDPIQNIEGFYFWINGKIERCKGFFLFDKTGVQITVVQENEDELKTQAVVQDKNSPIRTIITAVMGVAIVALLVLCLSLHSKVNVLQNQQQALVESANNSLYNMSLQINSLYSEIDSLQARIKALEPEETVPEQEDDNGDQEMSDNESGPAEESGPDNEETEETSQDVDTSSEPTEESGSDE